MKVDLREAVSLALIYIDRLCTADRLEPEAVATAILAYLADQGFVVRWRDGGEHIRGKVRALKQRRMRGDEIRTMRIEAGMSMTKLATRAGVHPQRLFAIDSGRVSPQT